MDIPRREFLKRAGLTTATAVVGAVASPLIAEAASRAEGNPDRFGVLTDTTLCIGLNCRRCEIACAAENNLPPISKPPEDETVFDEVRRMHHDQYTVVNRFPNPNDPSKNPVYVKRQCMHCDDPACASACFVKALRKTPEGPVVYDASLCVGCRYCLISCPFGVPAYEYNSPLHPRVRKCTMCYETRTSKGLRPACVEACPNEVMTFGKRSDLIRLAYERISMHPDRYEHHVYGENEVGGTCWMVLAPGPFDKLGMRMDLGETPLPEFTRNYLTAAPLVLAMWPVFFGGIYLFTQRRQELMEKEVQKRVEENKLGGNSGKESA
jgi:formate dehydrogenase iron-sulfur subunit